MNLQTAETLKAMSSDQLHETGIKQGLKFRKNATDESMIEAILTNMQPMEIKPIKQIKVMAPVDSNTPEDVNEAIQKYLDKGLKAEYTDTTWYFKYRGAEDSGNLSIPLKVILMKAGVVAKGAFMLKTHREQDFGHMPANSKSSYTGKVLG